MILRAECLLGSREIRFETRHKLDIGFVGGTMENGGPAGDEIAVDGGTLSALYDITLCWSNGRTMSKE